MRKIYLLKRFDRALANQKIGILYNVLKVDSLGVRNSNHKPLIISCSKEVYGRDKRMRLFRYEAN